MKHSQPPVAARYLPLYGFCLCLCLDHMCPSGALLWLGSDANLIRLPSAKDILAEAFEIKQERLWVWQKENSTKWLQNKSVHQLTLEWRQNSKFCKTIWTNWTIEAVVSSHCTMLWKCQNSQISIYKKMHKISVIYQHKFDLAQFMKRGMQFNKMNEVSSWICLHGALP